MLLETYRAANVPRALETIRSELGEDALVLRTRHEELGDPPRVEVEATTADALEGLRARLRDEPTPGGSGGDGPTRTVALAGPTGAGKTTSAARLALHPDAFGDRRTGLVTLDTYRPGGFEDLAVWAEVAGAPLEVVYRPEDVAPALERLSDRDVVIVDTPGRGPGSPGDLEWRRVLHRFEPDEVHLVLPAHLCVRAALDARRRFADLRLTHLLVSKMDEAPDDSTGARLALEMDLPARWIGVGQEVPEGLAPAAPRILEAFGLPEPAASGAPSGRVRGRAP